MIPDLRIIDSLAGPVVPVLDIARQMGVSRTTISNVLRRHPTVFSPVTSSEWLETPRGRQKHTCIAKSAVEDLISHLRPLNRDNLPERIDAFRAAQIKKTTAITPALSDVLSEYARQAKALANEWGVDLPVAQRVSMAAAVEKYPDLTPYRALIGGNSNVLELPQKTGSNSSELELPQADPDFERYHSLEKLATFCQCSAKEAHRILEDEGVIECVNRVWRLTRLGERYGKMFECYPFWPHSMTTRWMIRYHPNAVQLVRGKLFCIQTTLPAKANAEV